MDNKSCFVAVEFVDDENVVGNYYWYLCAFEDVQVDDVVVAPLGRHNNLQEGVVRRVTFADYYNAPYPMDLIKRIRQVKKVGK